MDFNVPIAIEAAKLRCKYVELPTTDAIIAATAILMGSDYVITDDKHIKQIKETKTKWIKPFLANVYRNNSLLVKQ